jgi:hypothetical protein
VTNQLQTRLTRYRFDISEPNQEKQYKALMRQLCKPFRANADRLPKEGPIILETEHLFQNQWNSAPRADSEVGWRVFDHFQAIYLNKFIKEGYYLEMTQEMRDIRDNVLKCGFCGKQELAETGLVFCYKCLDSEYLKENDLFLLRLVPCSSNFGSKREPLSEAEKAHLLVHYIERQTRGQDSRAVAKRAKQREKVIAKRDKVTETAKTEAEGLIWLLDRNLNIDNVIYYPHTDRFCFGWLQSVSQSVKSEILNFISEFPFDYQIKVEDGTVLSNC